MRGLFVLLVVLSIGTVVGVNLWGAIGDEGDDVVRVPIERPDFAGLELTYADFFHPPFADQYPEVVATVNGEPITGQALAARQVMLELGRREALQQEDDLPVALWQAQLAKIEDTDSLEALIDEELERQAVERMGLLPSREEAAQFARQQEESFFQAVLSDPESLEEAMQMLLLQGFPEEDWASSEEIVESYRRSLGKGRLIDEECERAVATMGYLNLFVHNDCDDFLREERADADIVYFVRWADE